MTEDLRQADDKEIKQMREWYAKYRKKNPKASKRQSLRATLKYFNITVVKSEQPPAELHEPPIKTPSPLPLPKA